MRCPAHCSRPSAWAYTYTVLVARHSSSAAYASPPPAPLSKTLSHVANSAYLKPKPASKDYNRFVGLTGGQIFHKMMMEHDVCSRTSFTTAQSSSSTPNTKTSCTVIVCLQVKHVFGYPGGAILPVFDAIYNCKEMDLILPRHEQGGAHMAEGYARARYVPTLLCNVSCIPRRVTSLIQR